MTSNRRPEPHPEGDPMNEERTAEKDVPTGDALFAHFKVCDCHDSWDQCPCADGGHPADGSCDCCPFGIGLCGPIPEQRARVEAYRRGYDDGVEQERARVAKELERLPDSERLAYMSGYVWGYHLTHDDRPSVVGETP